jgi:arrestin-related trafficking adapter 3/6
MYDQTEDGYTDFGLWEGIPPKRADICEERTIMHHIWSFFDAKFANANHSPGADYVRLHNQPSKSCDYQVPPTSSGSSFSNFARPASPTRDEQKRLSLQLNQSSSFSKVEPPINQVVTSKGYRTFQPGDYVYNFELPLDSHLPETISVDLGSVKYNLEACIERAGAFRQKLVGSKEIPVIRAPAENSLEQVEPIAISRTWEDQLHYDIVISGKSFPLGSQIPIAFKLTPLAKVQCHRIKVLVTENIEYWANNRKVHRLEQHRKIPLLEKRSDGPTCSTYPGSTVRILSGGGVDFDSRAAAAAGNEDIRTDNDNNLLGNLEGEHNVGPTEMEFSVQLPSCSAMKEKRDKIHLDTTFRDIQVHHWIKVRAPTPMILACND